MTEMPSDIVAYNRKVIEDFRTNGAPEGRPLLLLTTTGARTGVRRTSPLMFVPDGDRLLVIAANAGSTEHPHWYGNLAADSRVTVEVGTDTYDATAVVIEGEERDALFARICADFPFFVEYQGKAGRQIPVVALERHNHPL